MMPMSKGLKIEKRPAAESPRPPVREFCELVEMFDILPRQLTNLARRSPVPFPEPVLVKGSRKWYELDAAQTWWKEVGGKSAAVSVHFERNMRFANRRRAMSSNMVSQS